MGAVSNLIIDDYPIFYSSKSYYEDVVNLIFLPEDFTKEKRALKERNKLIWGDAYLEEEGLETISNFITHSEICIDRLKIYGVTIEKAKTDFNKAVEMIKEDGLVDVFLKNEITFELYIELINEIINSKYKDNSNQYTEFKDYLVEYDLMIEYQSIEYGLFSILSTRNDKSIVEYDINDLIKAGWTSENPKNDIKTKKIIVFTEGKTDTEFIKLGLSKFKPHLLNMYHFIDFDNSRYEASASRLVHSVKSFVGSGIDNLIIAIFDNDVAGEKEMKILDNVILPDNIKTLRYPDCNFLKNYPTIGSTGKTNMNINGLAGSIEMYLSKECLLEKGELSPIKWTGYVTQLNKYQGVVTNKGNIQKRFRKKMKVYDGEIWEELDLLLNSLFDAFK